MPRAKKSIVWEHFIKLLDEGSVQCTICHRKMKFFGNTTNLKEHLRRQHPEHLAANELQNDGYIFFVDSPKVKRLKKLKEDEEPETTTEEINPEEMQLLQGEHSFTIKENPFGEKDFSVNVSRSESMHSEPLFHLGNDDFSKIVQTTTFIDKSLLIEELLRYNYVLITAPRGFGKSTNWDMVKRFLKIEVNEDGIPKDIRYTDNFKIFRDRRLAITERQKFCKDHMGQYPVISINLKPLCVVDSYADMLNKFKVILRRSFLEHRYLLKNSGLLLKSSNELFHKYCDAAQNLTLTVTEIEMGYPFLSELLFLHFRKQAIVMIDNYDSYLDSFVLKTHPDVEKIINFVQLIVKELLKSNQFVDRAFITGVFPVTSSTISTVSLNIKHFYFLDNHYFCKYFGITSEELSDVLKKVIGDVGEREKTERIIAEYYGGYLIPAQNITIYNLWSVLSYLENKRIPLNYWCQSEHYDLFKEIFSIKEIAEEMELLLLGMSRCTDISKALSVYNVRSLNNMLMEKNGASAEGLFLKVLYHLGYVTGNDSLTLDQSEMFLKIPNSEIRLEIARILKDTFIAKYGFKERHLRALHSATNAFSVQTYDDAKFEQFCRSLNDLFTNSNFYGTLEDSNGFQNVLFTFLASKFCITQSEIYKNNLSSTIDILTVNDSGVGIFIETKTIDCERKDNDRHVAFNAHRQIIDKKCCEYFDRNFEATMGKICIGICIGHQRKISIAYSYHFHIGDDIENPLYLEIAF
ncbi:unnamed protein product [Phyllotreta striolata]|uniref:BED-type domain-containing protein n=1 Tax=Phyllotreta striolata TaxID=444603 RepID=A0A9N9XWX6_PHYSR|nr:unnamed protein product [Phyllotreta striolata]